MQQMQQMYNQGYEQYGAAADGRGSQGLNASAPSFDPAAGAKGGRFTGNNFNQDMGANQQAQMAQWQQQQQWYAYQQMMMQQQKGGKGGAQQQDGEMNATVRSFLEDLKTAVTEGNVETLNEMYSKDYFKLSDQIAKMKLGMSNKWPTPEEASQFLGKDQEAYNLTLLYKELSFRHLYSKVPNQLQAQERVAGWENYMKLFDLLQSGQQKLPLNWLWDILDEFLYQYQQWLLFRARTVARRGKNNPAANYMTAESDLNCVKESSAAWDPQTIKNLLEKLVAQSGIEALLQQREAQPDAKATADQSQYIGYFALMQLIRYEIMLGEFGNAEAIITKLDFGAKEALYYKCPACHCSFYYHVGFAMMMRRRFSDAMVIFGRLLHFAKRLERFPPLSALYEASENRRLQEKMSSLLGMCYALAPDSTTTRLDGYVLGGAMERTAKAREANFTTEANKKDSFNAEMMALFHKAAPTFVTIVDLDVLLNAAQTAQAEEEAAAAQAALNADTSAAEAGKAAAAKQGQLSKAKLQELTVANTQKQGEKFKELVEQQKAVPHIQSYLQMFSNISVNRLLALSGVESKEKLVAQLQFVKGQNMQTCMVESASGARAKLVPGVQKLCTDCDFDLVGENIVVNAQKTTLDYTAYFATGIKELQATQRKIKELKVN